MTSAVSPCAGPDGDDDCAESCDEAANDCLSPDPNGSSCDDGLFCNGMDVCYLGQCQMHGGDPCTGPDDDADCAESCDEAADDCTAADGNGSSCDDGLFCTLVDSCLAGACVGSDDPCTGSDGDDDCAESSWPP